MKSVRWIKICPFCKSNILIAFLKTGEGLCPFCNEELYNREGDITEETLKKIREQQFIEFYRDKRLLLDRGGCK